MPRPIDLHMHTNLSDGLLSPPELLDRVRKSKLSAFSVTDHDTLAGWRMIAGLLTESDPELVTGVELSVRIGDEDLHILAYDFDPDLSALTEALDLYQARRSERGREIVNRLQNLGLDITFEQVKETAVDGVIGRPHIAEALYRLGLTKQYDEAFYKYIGNGGPAYVPKYRLAPAEAFDLVHASGGVAILAHPAIGDMWRHIDLLVPAGLDGIEAYHYSHASADIKRAKQVAKKYNLILSGGSDFHGRGSREATPGSLSVPPEYLDRIKERAMRYRSVQ